MGRSKFPGKPSKTVTRKRIKVLGRPDHTTQAAQSNSTSTSTTITVAENIYYGLSHSKQITNDNSKEQHQALNEVNTKNECELIDGKSEQLECDAGKLLDGEKRIDKEDKINWDTKDGGDDEGKDKVEDKLSISLINKSINDDDDDRLSNVIVKNSKKDDEELNIGCSSDSNNKPKVSKGVKFKRVGQKPILKSVNNILDRHQRTRQLRNSTAKRLLQRAKFNIGNNNSNNTNSNNSSNANNTKSNSNSNRNITVQSSEKSSGVKKFVLPMRSAHSSRVIKPNKRFIEELEDNSVTETSENENIKQNKKIKFAKSKLDKNKGKKTTGILCNKSNETTIKGANNKNNLLLNKKNRIQCSNKKTLNLNNKIKKTIIRKSTTTNNNSNVNVNNKDNSGILKQNNTLESIDNDQLINLPNSITPNNESSDSQTKLNNQIDSVTPTAINNSKSDTTIDNKSQSINLINDKDDKLISLEENKCEKESNVDYNNSMFESNSELTNSSGEDDDDDVDGDGDDDDNNKANGGKSDWNGMKLDGGKIILRKARLKIENKNPLGTEGPFSGSNNNIINNSTSNISSNNNSNNSNSNSSNINSSINNNTNNSTNNINNVNNNTNGSSNNNINVNNNSGLTGTVKCGVCGAVYRFVKHARKFGIYSCESCRKFISKIIKRQACAKSTSNSLPILQCHKGDGLCLVPPIIRSQQWNLMRCAYKTRCPACWLKMCLKCYNIPGNIKSELNTLLPAIMRDPVITSLGSLIINNDDCENGQKLLTKTIGWPSEDSLEKNLFKSAINWTGLDSDKKFDLTNDLTSTKFDKLNCPKLLSLSKKRKKDNRIKVRKKVKNPSIGLSLSSATSPLSTSISPLTSPSLSSSSSTSSLTSNIIATNQPSSQSLRQRFDLKGPRVKHVCRSASVALGQPIATFPTIDGKDESETLLKPSLKLQKDDDKPEKSDDSGKEKDLNKLLQENNGNSVNNNSQTYPKRFKTQNILVPSYQVPRALYSPPANQNRDISIDFWEQYDPIEIGAKGFALIAFESFDVSAICFLCGSAGKEPLIHCQCCCEPYHSFCLEPSEWNACVQPEWCCPRCTICQTCQERTGPKLSCIRCRQSFHHSCLSKNGISARLYSPDRPYICQSCIKCKSCGSEGVKVYVGNLPLCSICFKLRQRGNYCPLCQRCYNENDFDTKMMECNECSCWVHARCEGLSDEFYQVLSYLPDSVEFTCSQCSPNPNSIWRNAIESELKTGFIAVLKSLSKNRDVCTALKWTPRKECICKPITSVRKLDFSDEKLNKELSNEFEDNNFELKVDNLSQFDFEIDDQPLDTTKKGVKKQLRRKFHLKECSVRVKNCISKDNQDPKKDSEGSNQDYLSDNYECQCSDQEIIVRPSPTLMSVKRKVNGNEYQSLLQFHCDMEHVVNRVGDEDLVKLYHKTLQEIFPWFDPKCSKINSNGGGFTTPTKDLFSKDSLDSSILEKWKEEVLLTFKSINSKQSNNIYENIIVNDKRCCVLCKGIGDGEEVREGRLLYCGQNEWIHSNCALWSNEVFEEIDGSLQNVQSAISRGRLIRCAECGKKGASVGCCAKNCGNTFHYPCARNAGLGFNDDKTIFCSLHLSNCANKNPEYEDDFCLKRLVYVELDRKKKKYIDPDQVKVMIGSIIIDCLGTIVPEFSDSLENIIPINYKCSKLFWSTVNPMKLVKYYIRTFIQTCTIETTVDTEHNITIDHSKEREIEERQKLDNFVVKQTLDTIIDTIQKKEMDENFAEQNNTDLLPPEITDVIFEDLPHDLLDGISMQDIFPKMSYEDFLAMDLKNDNVFGNDLLKDEILSSEVDEIIKLSDNKMLKLDSETSPIQNDLWFHLETKSTVQDLVDDLMSTKNQKIGGKELKRSKSEVIGNNHLMMAGQRHHHQRSCSLTWSCKLDGTYGPSLKRRKLPRQSTIPKNNDNNLMVVDSANDKSSVFHELRIPDSIMVAVGRTNTPPSLRADRELKYCIDDTTGSLNRRILPGRDDVTNKIDHKRRIWQSRQPRIHQLAGSADSSSASECSSPEYNLDERIPQVDGSNDEFSNSNWFTYKIKSIPVCLKERGKNLKNTRDENSLESLKIPQLDGADDVSSDDETPQNVEMDQIETNVSIGDGPVTCKRCQCTYRTHDSYNRHLSNCDIVSTSDSDSETMDNKSRSPTSSTFSDSIGSLSPQFITMSPSEGHTIISDYADIQITSPLEASVPSSHSTIQSIEPIAQAIITPQIHTHSTVETVHQTVLTSNDVIVQTQYTRTTTTLPNPSNNTPVLSSSPENPIEITEITDNSIHNETNYKTVNTPQISPDVLLNSNSNISNSSVTTGVEPSQLVGQFAKSSKSKIQKSQKPKTKAIKPQMVKNSMPQQPIGSVKYQTVQNTAPILQLQQSQRPTAPTVILQQVNPPGLMSAYVESLQQQSGQNLQYITAIGGQENTYKPQFITTNQLVPSAYIQTSSDNLLALPNGGISVMPSVQIGQPQPTVLGTIIQQQPNAIQCGVISSEQLVLSSTPTLEMFTDSTGSMFVSNQPMYYGLETIVSNTVMSSSQFMTGTVPQVLASSYQTTTQVFQASKLMEPLVDVQTIPSVPSVQPVQNVQPVQSISAVQAVQNVPNIHPGYVVVNQPTQDVITTSQQNNHLSVNQDHQVNFDRIPNQSSVSMDSNRLNVSQIPDIHSIVPPTTFIDNNINREIPKSTIHQQQQQHHHHHHHHHHHNQPMNNIPRVAVRPSPVSNINPIQQQQQSTYEQWKIPDCNYNLDHTINSRPYFDSKYVSENTSMIKSSLSSKIPPLSNHCVTQRDVVNKFICDMNNENNIYNINSNNSCSTSISSSASNNINVNSNTILNSNNIILNNNHQNKVTTSVGLTTTTRPMNRVLPMQATVLKQDTLKQIDNNKNIDIEKSKNIDILDEQDLIKFKEKLDDLNKKIISDKKSDDLFDETKEYFIIEKSFDKNLINEHFDIIDENNIEKDKLLMSDKNDLITIPPSITALNTNEIEESKENFKFNLEKDNSNKLTNTSLKIVLQKQLQDGSYKITHNMKTKNLPKITSVEILPSKQAPHIAFMPIKKFNTFKKNKSDENNIKIDSTSNLGKTKAPPIAVKKPKFNNKTKRPVKIDSVSIQKRMEPRLMYEVKSQDGFTHIASSMSEIWDSVFQAVQTARKSKNLPPLNSNPLTNDIGLDNNATVYLVEQLAGVNRCAKYKPKYHNLTPPKIVDSDILIESTNGAARAEPFKGRKVHDMFSWLASRHRKQPKLIAVSETELRRAASTNLPMAMRFRMLKETTRDSVGVYHSHIHGRGLFCLRDIEAGEMVIEYAGEVIRASLTDKREKYYDSKHIGCYMFKIDDHLVVDATMKGNAARFINHSCEPNCYSKVVDILGKKHILIFALRRILRGEELTYDYKFPFEDVKIPCTCGSRKCRKYLN